MIFKIIALVVLINAAGDKSEPHPMVYNHAYASEAECDLAVPEATVKLNEYLSQTVKKVEGMTYETAIQCKEMKDEEAKGSI